MSVQASTWAWQQSVPPHLKLVLVALADFAHADGTAAYPSKARLGVMTGYSERQIQRTLGDLIAAKVIRMEKRATRYRPTEYALNIEESFTVLRGDNLSPLEDLAGETPTSPRGDTHVVSGETPMSPEPRTEPEIEPSIATPAPDGDGGVKQLPKPHAYDHPPAVCCLIARWYDGWSSAHPGVRPNPSVTKRVAGQAKNVAKDQVTHEDWVRAAAAAFSAGEQGIYDIVQGFPIARKPFVDPKVAEQDAIFAPAAARARVRMAERDTKILAERAANGS